MAQAFDQKIVTAVRCDLEHAARRLKKQLNATRGEAAKYTLQRQLAQTLAKQAPGADSGDTWRLELALLDSLNRLNEQECLRYQEEYERCRQMLALLKKWIILDSH